MGRAPLIRDAVLRVLEAHRYEGPLGFSELKDEVERILGTVHKGSLSNTLAGLVRNGLVEIIYDEQGRKRFRLSRIPPLIRAKSKLATLVRVWPPEGAMLEGNLLILIDPPPAQTLHIEHEMSMDDLVSDLVLETLGERLKDKPGRWAAVVDLIAWGAWTGWRHMAEGAPGDELGRVLSLGQYLGKLLSVSRVEDMEPLRREAVMAMLSAAEAPSLRELVSRLALARVATERARLALEEQFIRTRRWHQGYGEVLRDLDALTSIIQETWPSYAVEALGVSDICPPGVFRALVRKLFERPDEVSPDVEGDFGSSKAQLEALKQHYLQDLHNILASRRILYVKLHGVSLKEHEVATYLYNSFERWLQALKEGRLDHRTWIFRRSTIRMVIRALRLVKRNKPPEPVRIDMEGWTLRDLHKYHPRGKDPVFWEELLKALEEAAHRVRSQASPDRSSGP